MNDYYEILKKYNILISNISYVKGKLIVTSSDGKRYYIKDNNSDSSIFKYLEDIDYPYYLKKINDDNDSFELYYYYDNNVDDDYKIGKEMVSALVLLHNRTYSFSENVDLKNYIEEYSLLIDKTMKYYLDIHDYIDELDFLSPQFYLLLLNISKIYNLINLSKKKLDILLSKDKLSIRKVICVGDCSISNFSSGDKKCFIDWGLSSNNYIVFDLVSLYKSNINNIDVNKLFINYCKEVILSQDEKNFLFCIICIPDIISFSKNNYFDTLNVRKLIDYVDKTYSFVLEEDEKYEKTNEKKFSE